MTDLPKHPSTSDWESTSFAIAVPYASDFVPIEFAQSMMRLKQPPKSETYFIGHTITSAARNIAVRKAIQEKHDYIFFIDSDMTLPKHAIRMLWEHGVDVVSGLYMPRRGQGKFMAFDYDEKHGVFINRSSIKFTENLLSVDGSGGGCLLIKLDVFDKIDPPYFFYNDKLPMNEALQSLIVSKSKGSSIDVLEESMNYGYGYGEDLNFFLKLREAGIKAYVDPKVVCGHMTMVSKGNPNMTIVRKDYE
jgi:hypothetical protein